MDNHKLQFRLINRYRSHLILRGDWLIDSGLQHVDDIVHRCRHHAVRDVKVSADTLGHWDSSLVIFLLTLKNQLSTMGMGLDLRSCPDNLLRMVEKAETPVERQDVLARVHIGVVGSEGGVRWLQNRRRRVVMALHD